MRPRSLAALVGTIGALAGLPFSSVAGAQSAPAPAVAAAEGAESPVASQPAGSRPVASLRWTPCPQPLPAQPGAAAEQIAPIECATLPVPLDYGDPAGRQIPLALYRLRSPNHGGAGFEGSLLMNPGGPGGPGKDFLAGIGSFAIPTELSMAYDLVSFDPRGVADSDGLACALDDEAAAAALAEIEDPVELQETFGALLGAACMAEDPALVAAMGTANVARDVDRIRAALGERELDYLGFSYGTLIGAVYAQLFPDRVGRFVLDGAVDPTSSRRTTVIGQALAFEDALQRFAAACDGEERCPFRVGGTMANLDALLEAAQTTGLPVGPDGERLLDINELFGAVVPFLYQGHGAFPALAAALAEAAAGDASTLAAAADSAAGGDGPGSFYAVECADADARYDIYDVNFATWVIAGRAPHFELFELDILTCNGFPQAQEPFPTLRRDGLPPALIIGNTHDLATPYENAVALDAAWGTSTLVTYVGDGHTASFKDSSCVDVAVVSFLLDEVLPDGDLTCEPDRTIGVLPALPVEAGVVAEVDPTGPAAGLLAPGDRIVSVEGVAFDPVLLVALIAGGEPFVLVVERGGALVEVTLAGEVAGYWQP